MAKPVSKVIHLHPRPQHLMTVILLLAFCCTIRAQRSLSATEIIDPTDAVTLTFHKVTEGVESEALDLTNPALSFRTGNIVRVKYKASYESFVYIVNSSSSGGATLQYPRSVAQNVAIPANEVKAFSFRLTNREGVRDPVREELILIVSRTVIKTPSLNNVLEKSARLDQLNRDIARSGEPPSRSQIRQQEELEQQARLPNPPEELKNFDAQPISVDQKLKKQSKTKTFAKIACGVLAGWLGPVFRIGCAVAGLGAAEFVEDSTSNTIAATPSGQTDRLFLRLSFEHSSQRE